MQDWRVKCLAKREMNNARAMTIKSDKPATQSIRTIYRTKMFKIGKAKVMGLRMSKTLGVCVNIHSSYCGHTFR